MKNSVCIFVLAILCYSCSDTSIKSNNFSLPIFGEKTVLKMDQEGFKKGDTLYHKIPYFEGINHNGDTVSSMDYQDKIFIANFFFTSCAGICPPMMQQLQRVEQNLLKFPDVQILSYSVDPERDTPDRLLAYTNTQNLHTKRWNLLTGNKEELYDMAITGYFANIKALEGDANKDFIHSQMLFLIDNQFRIRGVYDALDTKSVNRLIHDTKQLYYQVYPKG